MRSTLIAILYAFLLYIFSINNLTHAFYIYNNIEHKIFKRELPYAQTLIVPRTRHLNVKKSELFFLFYCCLCSIFTSRTYNS
jgi:hypothetical protein